MHALLKRVRNFLVYFGAGLLILLAVAVGLFRLFLPRLTEYQEDIKGWATAAIGMEVDFAGMDARWRLSGPEVNFQDAELSRIGSPESLIEAAEVTIGVGLIRLLVDRTLVVDRIVVRGTQLDFTEGDAGATLVQGLTLDELADMVPASTDNTGDVVVVAEDVIVTYARQIDTGPVSVAVDSLEATRRDDAIALEASIDLDAGFGSRLDVTVDQILAENGDSSWQVYLEGRSIGLQRWAGFVPEGTAPVINGEGDLSLWLELSSSGVDKATANVALEDVGIAGAEPGDFIDVEGRIEFAAGDNSVLIAAENLSLGTAFGRWPRSSIQLQLYSNDDGDLVEVTANASYANLDDIRYFLPWVPDAQRQLFDDYAPTGQLSDLRLNVANLDTDSARIDLAVEATEAGINANGSLPGIRGFTGAIRADDTGGRVEMVSSGMRVDVPDYVPETIILDDALGTIIWRRNDAGVTVLTDRLQLRSTDFDSRSSLQVSIPVDGGAPVVDLDSAWSINDVASAKRFMPRPVMHPALIRWLDRALVSGSLRNGTARLTGPLDKFPFDNGEGQFLVTARMEDGILDYANGWPAAAIRSMDVNLEGLRLYTERNTAVTAGNRAVDARVEIADLRKPVLTINAFASGSLESIRQFGLRSPISNVFGGRLDTVRVNGDASFELDLVYPINNRREYAFRTRIRPSNGSVELLGFPAAISELNGVVDVTRETIDTESLFGTFLGQPITIDLERADDDNSSYSVAAYANGRVSAEGLIEGLGAPLSGLVEGATDYSAVVQFPKPGADQPAPVRIALSSDLIGFGVRMPQPLAKSTASEEALSLVIEFPPGGRLAASGTLGERVRWNSEFYRDEYGWDFDRGALALGGDYPPVAESRGLHIDGHIDEIRLSEWLDLSRNQRGDGPRFTDRVRSIDLEIDHLRLFGQHLVDHRITVDRSGAEWFVRASGDQVAGTATIPYDLSGERPVTLDMQSLILPGDDANDGSTPVANVDPRTLPAIHVRADEFAIGERYLGKMEAKFERTGNGLRADAITAEDASFSIDGTAGWIHDPGAVGLSRTSLNARLVSGNVQRTMTRLDYDPGIESDRMQIDVDVNWPGGPRADFLGDLSGEVTVSLDAGQLNEVEPGAGRVFGLMSVVALPRRLSLDFSDVLERGFGFDEITGSFSLSDGDAYTCDLSLKGPAADIGIIGRAGLASGEYEQTAIVSANVGNTLPVVGAVVAGPQAAAALLIFSQIFKKPLQDLGQAYYTIDGTFDEPLVESANAERFAAMSEQANCLVAVE